MWCACAARRFVVKKLGCHFYSHPYNARGVRPARKARGDSLKTIKCKIQHVSREVTDFSKWSHVIIADSQCCLRQAFGRLYPSTTVESSYPNSCSNQLQSCRSHNRLLQVLEGLIAVSYRSCGKSTVVYNWSRSSQKNWNRCAFGGFARVIRMWTTEIPSFSWRTLQQYKRITAKWGVVLSPSTVLFSRAKRGLDRPYKSVQTSV